MAVAMLPKIQSKRLWTYDEMVAELPETNQPIELWDGELITSPTPTPSHQTIVGSFYRALHQFVHRKKAGKVFPSPLDVVLSQHRTVQPDVLFISNANRKIIQDRIRGVPDLVYEVISPGTWKRDRVEKKSLYEQVGVAEYWIVDPESHTIEVFVLNKESYQLNCRAADAEEARSKLLAGFEISFNELQL